MQSSGLTLSALTNIQSKSAIIRWPLVKDIYSRTTSTIAWLGPRDDQTETAFRKIDQCMRDRVGDAARLYVHLAHKIESTVDKLNTLFKVEFGADEAARQWKAVASIF